jgi:hypothetical protein
MGTDRRPILATNHLLLICQCHYVGDLSRNSTPTNPNSKHDFGGCFCLSWWTWRPPHPDDVSCIGGMLRASLEATGCRLRASIGAVSPQRLPWSSMLLCYADGHKTQLLASMYHTKQWTDQLGFFANQRIIETRTISMTRSDLTISSGTPFHNYLWPDIRENIIFIVFSDSL